MASRPVPYPGFSRQGDQPMSQEEYAASLQRQARERSRRGLVDFTRPARREQVMGKVAESPMGQIARESQIDRRTKQSRQR